MENFLIKMQIFVKFARGASSEPKTINGVEATTTIEELRLKIKTKLQLEKTKFPILLLHNGKSLSEDKKTVGELGIKKEDTIHVRLGSLRLGSSSDDYCEYDPAVEPLLRDSLEKLSKSEKRAAGVIFIGLGCFDHGHGDNESIRRQQCPELVLTRCKEKRLPLTIILIDKDFGRDTTDPQIYDIDESWKIKMVNKQDKILFRKFKYVDHPFQLLTFATDVLMDEYLGEKCTLAALDITTLLSRSTVIVGNFYEENAIPHVCVGDIGLLREL